MDPAASRLNNTPFTRPRRSPYEGGFPAGDPEMVFKFRHPDIQKTAETDVRPNIDGDYRIKFKAEVLPLKDSLGGMRMLYSHNVEFTLTALQQDEDRTSLDGLVRMFPPLAALKRTAGEKV